MNTISPVLDRAFHLVRTEMFGYLDSAEYLAAATVRSEQDEEMTRAAVMHLLTVVRGLIAEHESSSTSGRCKTCETAWPCPMTESIHRLMHDPDTEFYKIVTHVNSIA